MARVVPSSSSRKLLIASLVFGAFVLCDITLFGWLIFRSLSQREIERVLLETRSEAEKLAQQLARRADREKDLYTAVAVERETQTYIDQVLRQRELVRRVVIRDKNGVLVYEGRGEARMQVVPEGAPPTIAPPILSSPELQQHLETSPRIEKKVRETESSFEVPDIQVPIGSYGQLEIGISAVELSRRIQVLRADLIRQTTLIGVVSMLLLVSAYAAVWKVLRRSQRLEVQAAQAERLAYLGTLASGLAHEIRNPLNSLNLNMQMLEEEIDEHGSAPTGKRLLSITRSELSRLERLVSDFLAYAKPRPLEMEEVPAVRPLERVREVLAGVIQKRQVQVEIEDRRPAGVLGRHQGVLHEVEEELVHLPQVHPDPRAGATVVQLDLGAALADLPRQHLADPLQQAHRRDLLQLQRTGLRVSQEVGDQALQPGQLGAGDREQPLAHRRRAPLVDLLLEHLHVEAQRVERVADLVGEA
ncbi:MAG TPA: histidine kinase dimerization/phospho-acceptor domain-containing protein [Thermoanaerobaculia bacterium]|nr:histidine kinase dimerization/phospho-acceptor domain-containing protein [Thermoanaerobaculia bacterium]